MSYRNKTYVALDYDEDATYYNMMKAWKENDHIEFDFNNAHDLNRIMPYSSEETIKRNLWERMKKSKNFILLVGQKTQFKTKFVRWEIEHAIDLELPIIVSNLNNKRQFDDNLCPAILDHQLAIHISFGCKIIQYSLDKWPDIYLQRKREDKTEPRYWEDSVYNSLGL